MPGMAEPESDDDEEDEDNNGWDGRQGLTQFQFGWSNEKDQNPFAGKRLISSLTARSTSTTEHDLRMLKIYKRKMKYHQQHTREAWHDSNDLFGAIGQEAGARNSKKASQYDFLQHESIKRVDEATLRKLVIIISHCSPKKMTEALKHIEQYAAQSSNSTLFYSVLMTTLQQ